MAHSNRSRWWIERALLLLLLLVGAGLRLWDVGNTPPGLYHDEAQNGLDALAVLETGRIPLYFPANNGREPLFIYLITISIAVLGRSPLAVRLPAFFVGFLTLAATYDLAKVLWGRRAGRWALAVLAVTFWHVHLSRVGFRAVLLPLFTALFLAQAVRALRTGKMRHWVARRGALRCELVHVHGRALHAGRIGRHGAVRIALSPRTNTSSLAWRGGLLPRGAGRARAVGRLHTAPTRRSCSRAAGRSRSSARRSMAVIFGGRLSATHCARRGCSSCAGIASGGTIWRGVPCGNRRSAWRS